MESLHRIKGVEFVKLLALWWLSLWPAPTAPRPQPDLTPAQVVETVAAALRNYNSPIPNAGIYTAYCFASPANHAITGPYGTFIGRVKSADFTPLLHNYPAQLSPISINGDLAEQIVTVHVNPSHDPAFKFTLTRQHDGPCPGCWMVDGVTLTKP
jgi:hypothetical protein